MACVAVSAAPCAPSAASRRVAFRARPAAAFLRRSPAAGSSSSSNARLAARRSPVAVRAVLDVTEGNFEAEVLQAELPVLVDVWAHWCGPCKLMAPLMDWAEKEYAGVLKVVKIEADPNPGFVEKYKVYGLPCFLLFKGGEVVEGSQSEGAMPKKALQDYLASFGIEAVAQV